MPRFLWKLVRLVIFRFDAERVHEFFARLVRWAIRQDCAPLVWVSGAEYPGPSRAEPPYTVLGMTFRNRVGLAAGFDKNAELLVGIPALGFGFAEIGSVTPYPQAGNPRPRLFRDAGTQSLFNRMGFNNHGAAAVSARLAQARPKLPIGFRVGVNLGKNKDTPNELAHEDYATVARSFAGLVDFSVINISSPNTPGLRALQTPESIARLAESVLKESRGTPVLLKLAPEIEGDELVRLIDTGARAGLSGFVLTNTLAGEHVGGVGGYSGGRLKEISRNRLIEARAATRLPLISVGGIDSVEEARKRVLLGADLIQIYSSWIYQGPRFPVELDQALGGS